MKINKKFLISALCFGLLVIIAVIVMPKIQLKINPGVTAVPVVKPDSATPKPVPTLDPNKDYVVIYVGNTVYDIIPLGETKLINVKQKDGIQNDVSITVDGVHMAFSTCDNQNCIQQGEVTIQNSTTRPLMNWIVCLPNQVSVELIIRELQ